MNKLLSLASIIAFLFLSAACSSYSPASEFASLADELEQKSASYTTEDWENAIATYQSIIQYSEGYEFSNEELQEIGRQQGRCLSYITKGYAKIAAKVGSSYLNQLKGIFEGFTEEFGDGSDIANDIIKSFDGLLESNDDYKQ